jgi:hypothetical protein
MRLKDGMRVKLKKNLYYINNDNINDYQYLTMDEIQSIAQLVHHEGDEFTYSEEDKSFYSDEGTIQTLSELDEDLYELIGGKNLD